MSANPPKVPQQALIDYAMKELSKIMKDIQQGKTPSSPKKLQEIYENISTAQKELQENKITEEELEKKIEEEAKKVQ